MKIGIDVDGVLADFTKSFNTLAKAHLDFELPAVATTWDYHLAAGMSKKQSDRMWDIIKTTPFFVTMLPLPGAIEAIDRLNTLSMQGNDIYFITHRPGHLAKFWTELWLKFHGMDLPTVLVAGDKGPVARGLKLDVFVDDKPENNLSVIDATGREIVIGGGWKPTIRVYLIDHPYNQWADQPFNYGTRIGSLNEVLDREFQEERKAA